MLTIEKIAGAEDTVILHLQGDLTIETVTDLREALLDAFGQSGHQVQLDARELATADFFGLQLLCSAHRTAMANKKLLTWFGQRPPQIDNSMQISGYTRHCGCILCPPGVDCMWV